MAVDSIHPIDDRDFQARGKRLFLESRDHRIPGLGSVLTRRTTASAENGTDGILEDVAGFDAVLFHLGHLADLFFECHALQQIFEARFDGLGRIGVEDRSCYFNGRAGCLGRRRDSCRRGRAACR